MGSLSLGTEDFKGSNVEKSFSNNIEKGKAVPIGTVSGGYKKEAEGKWVPVKEGKEGHDKNKPSMYSDAMAEKKQKKDKQLGERKKPTEADKKYFQENKEAIMAIIDDDIFMPISEALEQHRNESKQKEETTKRVTEKVTEAVKEAMSEGDAGGLTGTSTKIDGTEFKFESVSDDGRSVRLKSKDQGGMIMPLKDYKQKIK